MEALNYDKSLVKGFLDGLRPFERLTVSQWSDRYRYLSPSASAEPGLWRTDRTPYLRDILDSLSVNDPHEQVVVMKGAQLGFTEAGNNWVGYLIDIAPCPIMLVQPTDMTVKRNSRIRISPMIESSPRLKAKVAPERSRDSSNTVFSKDFPGGVLVMTGANSAVGLRSMPVKALFLDEVDGYPADLDGEGSPIDLAKARTRTFAKKKIYIVSTPTVEGSSAIQKEFESTDQRYFFVPCPHCGGYQRLIWANLKWEKGKPYSAKYQCEHCDELIEERYKPKMFASGIWKATVKENISPHKIGFHINSLYSPFGWYSWADAAQEWEDAQGDVTKLKVFVNTVLGETWKEKGDAPPHENLYNRREDYELNKPNNEVCFITAGADVQKDRIEVEIVGWCKGRRSYSLDYRVLMGDTANDDVWAKLREIVDERWVREDGIVLPLRLMAVDTGYNTKRVYDFCSGFDITRVIPTKGQDRQVIPFTPPKAVEYTSNGKKIGNVKLFNIGVSLLKSELYGWLRQEKAEDGTPPPGFCHFPQYDHLYFKGLTAEELQFKVNKRGQKVYEWVKKFERNEPLDCRIYARAAAAVLGMDSFTDKHYEAMAGTERKEKKKQQRRSSYWDR